MVALLALGLALAACETRAAESGEAGSGAGSVPFTSADADAEIVFGEVGDFTLTAQDGTSFGRKDLLGKTWILSNIFTTCTGPCPSVTAGMVELQRRLEGTDVRLLSISVDPNLDTPGVMRAYGEAFEADFDRWTFLTGDEEEIHALLVKDLFLATQRAPEGEAREGEQVSHDVRVVAIDAEGRVRGYYDGRSEQGLGRVEARVRWLASR